MLGGGTRRTLGEVRFFGWWRTREHLERLEVVLDWIYIILIGPIQKKGNTRHEQYQG